MKIILKKYLASIGFDYSINVDDELTFVASNESVHHYRRIAIKHLNEKDPYCSIKKKLMSFRPKYGIKTVEKEKCNLVTLTTLKRHYQIKYKDVFDIYGHKNSRKFSVYKNGIQIAWWELHPNFEKNCDSIVINCTGEFRRMVLAACLIIDDILNNEIMHRSIGYINLPDLLRDEIKQFDEAWEPGEMELN